MRYTIHSWTEFITVSKLGCFGMSGFRLLLYLVEFTWDSPSTGIGLILRILPDIVYENNKENIIFSNYKYIRMLVNKWEVVTLKLINHFR